MPTRRSLSAVFAVALTLGLLAPTLQGDPSSGSRIRRLVVNGFGGVGIFLLGSDDNSVTGNWIGTDETGLAISEPPTFGILLEESDANEIGALDGAGTINVVAGAGTGIELRVSTDNVIRRNYVGTSPTGTADLGNGQGIVLRNSASNTLDTNVVAGNDGAGVRLVDGSIDNDVLANHVGLDVDLQPLPNGGDGVTVEGATSKGNTIKSNLIDHNGGLGIDLGDDGVTPNDNADADDGPNHLMNFPVLTRVDSNEAGTSMRLVGRIRAAIPNDLVDIQIFGSPVCDPSGHGEAQDFVFALLQVSTDSEGRARFSYSDFEPSRVIPIGWVATATATSGTTGSTSELSACFTVI